MPTTQRKTPSSASSDLWGSLHRGWRLSPEYFCPGKGEEVWLEGVKDHLVSPPKRYHSRWEMASRACSSHPPGLLENRTRCRSSGQSRWRDHKRHKVFGGNRGESANATCGTQPARLTVTSQCGCEALHRRVPRTGRQRSQKTDTDKTVGLARKLGLQYGPSWAL